VLILLLLGFENPRVVNVQGHPSWPINLAVDHRIIVILNIPDLISFSNIHPPLC